ncbi:MAG: radical SAM protein [Candidatus Aenigmatarchaeota archaeon]|nr:MAG: radical SAM protein [Candidatus Aenigmarchaeota archaeon]
MKDYFGVLSGKKLANFLVLKSIPVEFSREEELSKLWKLHDKKMGLFEKRKYEKSLGSVERNLLDLKFEISKKLLESCVFCERKCRANRYKQRGFCEITNKSRLSCQFLHYGEETILVPSHTFFFIGCNFYCVYCQNYTISRQIEKGFVVSGKELANMVRPEARNVNLVGGEPTPNLHTCIDMLRHMNINKPIIWNSNMFMSTEAMKLLNGCIDVFLADFKYGNNECAERLSKVSSYMQIVTRNLRIAEECGDLLIRHLVLPNHLECCTDKIFQWLSKNLKKFTLNVMFQYRPEFEAFEYEDIARFLNEEEITKSLELIKKYKLEGRLVENFKIF